MLDKDTAEYDLLNNTTSVHDILDSTTVVNDILDKPDIITWEPDPWVTREYIFMKHCSTHNNNPARVRFTRTITFLTQS